MSNKTHRSDINTLDRPDSSESHSIYPESILAIPNVATTLCNTSTLPVTTNNKKSSLIIADHQIQTFNNHTTQQSANPTNIITNTSAELYIQIHLTNLISSNNDTTSHYGEGEDWFENEHNLERNKKENIAFGDTIKVKNDNTTRFYFQNIRGAKKRSSWNDWQKSMEVMHTNQVDILGFAETNILWNAKNISEANKKTLKSYRKSHIQTSSSLETSDSNYQPGGTATIVTDNYTGRIEAALNDSSGLGRWSSGFQLRRKDNKFLYIITAYCPI